MMLLSKAEPLLTRLAGRSGLSGLIQRIVLLFFNWKLNRMLRSARRRGPSGGYSGTVGVGKPVPVGPRSPRYLVAAREFPPSDRTHSYPRD